jgi:hypothetical protein
MVKAYLRYEFSSAFGVITSSANPTYDASGKLLFTASLESISVWNAKQGGLVSWSGAESQGEAEALGNRRNCCLPVRVLAADGKTPYGPASAPGPPPCRGRATSTGCRQLSFLCWARSGFRLRCDPSDCA